MKIGVIGLGQMGRIYLSQLRKLGVESGDIIIWDENPERLTQIRVVHPTINLANNCDEFASSAHTFIVTVNTPAHAEMIYELAGYGAHHILCEKPLVQRGSGLWKVRNALALNPDLRIHTAMVIAFSPTRTYLNDLMQRENLVLADGGGRWCKNRGKASEKRPTAGDRVDECVHMIEYLLGLISPRTIKHVRVTAQLGYLPYADPDAQSEACRRDRSFPEVPDHSTQALLGVTTDTGEVQLALSSSFLGAVQERRVYGTLVERDSGKPAYAFVIDFDVSGVDQLTLTHIRTDKVTTWSEPCDKLGELTQSFLTVASGGEVDDRLASVEFAGRLVEVSDAIEASNRRRHDPLRSSAESVLF